MTVVNAQARRAQPTSAPAAPPTFWNSIARKGDTAMKYKPLLVLILVLTSCGRIGPGADIPATTTSAPLAATQRYTAGAAALAYTLAVPMTWTLVRQDDGGIRFQEGTPAPASDDSGDDQAYVGGVTILTRCADDADAETMYACVLPNHSTVQSVAAVTTPMGAGRVYLLEHTFPVGDQRHWWAQHALIPVDQYIFDIWMQTEDAAPELPTMPLAEMLATFRVTASGTTP